MLGILKWFFIAACEVAAVLLGLGVFFTILTDGVGGIGKCMRLLGLRIKLALLRIKRKMELELEIEKELAKIRKERAELETEEEVKSDEPDSAGDPVT